MALKHTHDPGTAARDVVQNGLGHLKLDAEFLHIGRQSAPQVVKDPGIRRPNLFKIESAGLVSSFIASRIALSIARFALEKPDTAYPWS
jgi:hypothetical protein